MIKLEHCLALLLFQGIAVLIVLAIWFATVNPGKPEFAWGKDGCYLHLDRIYADHNYLVADKYCEE